MKKRLSHRCSLHTWHDPTSAMPIGPVPCVPGIAQMTLPRKRSREPVGSSAVLSMRLHLFLSASVNSACFGVNLCTGQTIMLAMFANGAVRSWQAMTSRAKAASDPPSFRRILAPKQISPFSTWNPPRNLGFQTGPLDNWKSINNHAT